ncbi:MAG TPA: hypothetical protein VK013_13870 [Myxococcaceae bacterium]|nr:hypothetical protein [Myxococcaceae bacterium]
MKTGPLDLARTIAGLKRPEPQPAPKPAPAAAKAPAQPAAPTDGFDGSESRVTRSGHEQQGKRTTDWSFERNSSTQREVSGHRGRDGNIWEARGEASIRSDHDVVYDRESTYQLRPSTGQTGPRGGFVNKALDKGQQWGDKLAEMGLRAEFSGPEWDTRDLGLVYGGEGPQAGVTYGTAGSSNFSIGTDGLKADFDRAASAGAYANADGEIEGEYGSAAYQASAKAEAEASVSADAAVNLNGVDANFNAQAGVKVEATVSGQVESRPLTTIGGVDLTLKAEGTATVTAEAEAHATANVSITRDPPTAIIEGEAGASAVAKAEVEGSVGFGPIQLDGSAYASAGAEAVAGGAIGYQDGKFTIRLNVGAAVGVGAGVSGGITVDVGEIKEMAFDVADANGDGKLGISDAFIHGKNIITGIPGAIRNVRDAAVTVREGVNNAVDTVRDGVSNAVDNAKGKISGAASWVRGKFGW